MGIYGRFLCANCESKFQSIDQESISLFKQGERKEKIFEEGTTTGYILQNAIRSKELLQRFALSLVWRAAASGRSEYESLRLGKYYEKYRAALLLGCFDGALLSSTGFYFEEFRGGNSEVENVIFTPYRLHLSSNAFKKSYGRFHCHTFGFPFGKLYIRVGGEKPVQGYVSLEFESIARLAVFWSCNLSEKYPDWFYTCMPNEEILSTESGIVVRPIPII